jgi:hypothetical protein
MKAYSDGVLRSLLPQTLGGRRMRVSPSCRGRLTLSASVSPAAAAAVGDDLPEHGAERGRSDDLALANRNRAAVLLRWPAVVIPRRVRDKPAVVTEDVDVVPGQQRTDVALTHEVLLPGPLDAWAGPARATPLIIR